MLRHLSIQKVKILAEKFLHFMCLSPRCLLAYFVHGLIIVIPLAVTLWVIIWLFNLVDGMLSPIYTWAFGRPMPGLGFVTIVLLVIVIGFFGLKLGHRKAFGLIESRVMKFPLVGAIYGGTRQMLTSFTTTTNSRFLEVVFMEFPRKGIYTVGLVTSEIKNREGKKILNVYIPTAPNPTSGFLQIVPESDVIKTSMSVSDAMKLVISGGKVYREDIADMLAQVTEPQGKKKVSAG